MNKAFIIFVTIEAILFTFLIIGTISRFSTQEEKTITSHVDHIDFLKNYMIVHFKNGENYNIAFGSFEKIDFDESKNVTLKLSWRNYFWCLNTNDCWYIESIIKY